MQTLPIPGSARLAAHNTVQSSPVPCDQQIHVTVVLKSEAPASAYGAVERHAISHGLAIIERDEAKHQVVLSGAVEDMQEAFGVELHHFENHDRNVFHSHAGPVCVPAAIQPHVLAVLGLDTRPVAKPHFRVREKIRPHFPGCRPLTAVEVAKLYNFPTDATGKGQTIAMIELGGGYDQRDMDEYFGRLGLKTPKIASVSVMGARNEMGSDACGEVALDIQVCGAVAPDARYLVYFAPNTDQGFLAAINAAVHDANKCAICSISWGGPESNWSVQALNAFNQAFETAAALGVTVLAASGDNGASDGTNQLAVDFPASSPFVTACGGTRLIGENGKIQSESVWNDGNYEGAGGGGVSQFFPLPEYQAKSNVPGGKNRGVPDVCSNSDPETGYPIVVSGEVSISGGTSSAAPLIGGLTALINEKRGKNIGFLNPKLYAADKSCFNDVVKGDNQGYSAGAGWDPATGLGSPNGAALEKALS